MREYFEFVGKEGMTIEIFVDRCGKDWSVYFSWDMGFENGRLYSLHDLNWNTIPTLYGAFRTPERKSFKSLLELLEEKGADYFYEKYCEKNPRIEKIKKQLMGVI